MAAKHNGMTATSAYEEPQILSPGMPNLGQTSTLFVELEQAAPKDATGVVRTLSLISLAYVSMCGGPIGSEQIVSAGGPLVGLITTAIFSFAWAIPFSLINAELSAAFPHDGGFTIWALNAFGPFWAFQTGYWSWISVLLDNSVYPGLMINAVTDHFGTFGTPLSNYLAKFALCIAMALPNLLGMKVVGYSATVLAVIVNVPFVVLTIMGMAKASSWTVLKEVRHVNTTVLDDGSTMLSGGIEIHWPTLLGVLFWSFSGCTNVAVLGGEVQNPSRAYPKAMSVAVCLAMVTYIVPLVGAAAYNHPPWSTWTAGSYTAIVKAIGGNLLSCWIVVANVAYCMANYMTDLFCCAFNVYGMAEAGLAPSFFKVRNHKLNTPQRATMCNLLITMVLCAFPFNDIVTMISGILGIQNLFITIIFVKLRFTHAEVERPFKLPGNIYGIIALVTPACLILAYLIGSGFANRTTCIFLTCIIVFGLVYARINKFSRSQFTNLHL